jgi:hypothetical protein
MAELPPPVQPTPPAMPYDPYRKPRRADPMRASTVLGRTFSLWISTLPKLLAVAALVHLPRFAVRWFFLARPSNPVLVALQSGFESLEFLVVPAFVSVFAVYFVFQRLRDEPADLGRSIALGFRRILTSLGITAILGAPLFVLVYVSVHMSQEIVKQADRTDPRGAVASMGVLLLVAFATLLFNLIISLVFHVALPAAIVERLGMFPALGRSARLTSGRRFTIFVASLLLVLVTGIPAGIAEYAITTVKDPLAHLAAESAMQWFFGSLACVFPIVLYHELRRTKEGFGAEELAKAFD